VNKDGKVAMNYAFDGWKEQKHRLVSEGVEFVDEMHVDLNKYQANLRTEVILQ
jgi:alkylated DNA nucleotide flippase Atl1